MRKQVLVSLLLGVMLVSSAAYSDVPVLRVARPTNDMEATLKFYRDAVGLEVIGEFHDHEGFDGVMLSKPGAPYHLEFTQVKGHVVPGAPSQDNLVVFYLPDASEYRAALARMRAHGFAPVRSFNPYWDRKGATFEDAEGYRLVFYNGTWPPS